MFVDFDIVDPASVAAREIWLATQDWAAKSPKATKTRLEKAKTALQEVVAGGDKGQQDQAKHLIGMINAIDVAEGRKRNRKGPSRSLAGRQEADTGVPVPKKN